MFQNWQMTVTRDINFAMNGNHVTPTMALRPLNVGAVTSKWYWSATIRRLVDRLKTSNRFCSSFILTRELFPFVKMLLHLWMLFLLLPIVVFGAPGDSNDFTNPLILGYLYTGLLLTVTPYAFHGRPEGHSSTFIHRERRSISSMFLELGPMYTRRAYRMDGISFWALHKNLRP